MIRKEWEGMRAMRVVSVWVIGLALLLLPSVSGSQVLLRSHAGLLNPLEYGSTCTTATLNAALAAAPAHLGVLMLPPVDRNGTACAWTITSNLTIPTTLVLHVPHKASVTVSAGVTLTLVRYPRIDNNDWKTGSGTITIQEAPPVSGCIAVQEADGTPNLACISRLHVTNGTLTDNGSGVATITTGGGGAGGAPTTATYLTQTPDATLTNEQALSALGTGLVLNTTGTGVLSIFGGNACDAGQFLTGLTASGGRICATPAGGGDALTTQPLSQFAATTSAQLAGVLSNETGSGLVVFATSPTLTTPNLGVATATSLNKVSITPPTTTATLTLAEGKTLTVSNTLTLTGTDASSVAFGGGGTVVYTSRLLEILGTTNEVSVSGGQQTMAADRSWTVSLPATLNLSGKIVRVPSSTTLPATCTVGDAYMDTDATSGQRWFLCEAANSWIVQGTPAGGGITSLGGLTVSTQTITRGVGIGGSSSGSDHSLTTASGEADFLASGALTCGAGTRGKMQVHTTPLQYCDNAATPALQYAAYGTSTGQALTGDTATAFFTAGQLEAARGGTGIDTSACTGSFDVATGTWSCLTDTALSSSTTFTCNRDTSRSCEMFMTGAAGTITIAAMTGTPRNGDMRIFKLRCQNAQTLAWNTIYQDSDGVFKPSTCPVDNGKFLVVGVMYFTTTAKWQILAVNN